MSPSTTTDAQSVAITGLSCRFPGDGHNTDSFWTSICNGKSAWTEIPKDRFNIDAFHGSKLNTIVTRGAHFLRQDAAEFDAQFFNFSKTEASSMDPQHRMMIEVAYEALENSGLPLSELEGSRTGVFMGQFTSDYREMLFKEPEDAPTYAGTGTSKTSLANRISWLFDLRGPSFTLDTACSSSLVALHLACQSLRTGESDIAIVGGVNLLLMPDLFMYLSNQQFLSPDGKCKSFDASGDGYGRGEGLAAVVLRRVDDAISHGDPIRAVIRGTGTNQDGHTKGFTLPSAEAQAALIRDTYKSAKLNLNDTYYVEAHGTGTQAGDTQEMEALSKTISKRHSAQHKLLVGSVKSNIGHLEACAGLAGVIKSVFILESGLIPPTINHHRGNPKIPFDEWNVEVPTTLTPWPTHGLRRISTNSFGYGGANAHAVLDDAYHYLQSRGIQGNHHTKFSDSPILSPQSPLVDSFDGHRRRWSQRLLSGAPSRRPKISAITETDEKQRLFVLSTSDKSGLRRTRNSLAKFLALRAGDPEAFRYENRSYLRDMAYTLSSRRSALSWRTFTVGNSLEQLSEALEEGDDTAIACRAAQKPRLGFIFTGQGAQWPTMGMNLMRYPVFRQSVEAADQYLCDQCECSWSAVEELYKEKPESQLQLATFSQTLCTVLQVALVDLLASWGIRPQSVAGHSSGEIAAAYCLGALTKEDTWKVAYYRGILSSEMKSIAPDIDGAMMAVGTSPENAAEWISKVSNGVVVVACVNSPSSVTVSGDVAGIDELSEMLKDAGVFARKLMVDTAYHSPHMQMISQEYFAAISDIEIQQPSRPCKMHSSVIGRSIDPQELGASNWVRNLTSSVQFAAASYDMMRPMINGERSKENAIDLFVEIGPHSALQGPTTQTLKAHGINNIPYYSAIVRNEDSVRTALALAGNLFTHGVEVDISRVNDDVHVGKPDDLRPVVDLPVYPWNHAQTYWSESRLSRESRLRPKPRLSLLGAPTPALAHNEHTWRKLIRLSEDPWIADHQIQNSILYPAAGFLAMAIEAARQIADVNQAISGYRLRDVQIPTAAVITEDEDTECILQLRPHLAGTRDHSSTWLEFVVTSSPDGKMLQRNCSGLIVIEYEATQGSLASQEKLYESSIVKEEYFEIAQICKDHVTPTEFYEQLTSLGLIYGPKFANLTEIRTADDQSFCAVDIPETSENMSDSIQTRPHIIHPGTLDAIFHVALVAVNGREQRLKNPMIPKAIDEVYISENVSWQPSSRLTGFSNTKRNGFKELKADVMMLDEEAHHPVVQVSGVTLVEVGGSNSVGAEGAQAAEICSKLIWKPAVELLTLPEKHDIIESTSKNADMKLLCRRIGASESQALKTINKLLDTVPEEKVPRNMQRFHAWMKNQSEMSKADTHPLRNLIKDVHPDTKSLGSLSGDQYLSGPLFDRLSNLLIGQPASNSPGPAQDAVNESYLANESVREILRKLSEYLMLLYHTKPDMSVLEIGTSLGSTVSPLLLPSMTQFHTALSTAEYTISRRTVEEILDVKDRLLSSFDQTVKHAVFDIDQHPESQELKDQKFDVVVAFNLSATSEHPEVALHNARKMLKEGGELCLVEILNPGPYLSLLGCSATPSLDSLQPLLVKNGFRQSLSFNDFKESPLRQVGLVLASLDDSFELVPKASQVTLIQANKPSQAARDFSISLASALQQHFVEPSFFSWGSDTSSLKDKPCISLLELEHPFLDALAEEDFDAVKQLISNSPNLLWVVGHGHPSGSMVSGLARVIRNESPGSVFRTAHIETSLRAKIGTAELVARCFNYNGQDDEFRVTKGSISVSRLQTDTVANEEVERLLPHAAKKLEQMPLGKAPAAQKLSIQNLGMLDSLCLEHDELPDTELDPDQVEIDVRASALNFREVMVLMGQIPDSHLGFEASGIVRRIGSDVTKFKKGDKVVGFGNGAHRTVWRNKADHCEFIPEGMSFEQAATIPVVHSTAWYCLVHLAHVRKGQSILIHAAAGGVGQAAIQIAKHFEMEIFATVGSEVKRQLLRETYGIPDTHILNSRDLSFVKGVKRLTGGRGVDVILNSLSGEALRQSWHCIAPFGMFLEIGLRDILNNTELDMRPFIQDATFSFTNIDHLRRERPELMAWVLQGVFDFQRRGITRPITPLEAYPVSKAEEAARLMQTGKHVGKIALTYSNEDVVSILNTGPKPFQLSEDDTYLLVGGLGGLGRSISNMLVSHGARKLCFLSRSGGSSVEAQKLLKDLRARQVTVGAYSCDIADEAAIVRAIARCEDELGKPKGVIQCAMLLRDVLFSNMSHREWIEAIRPKVQGTWNLHQHLKDVDFFVTLSSFAATFGNRGQANYAAGGAYQDAIAHYRRSMGLHAVTLDLGIMRDVGVLAETGMTDALREWEEPYGIREPEFHALLKRAISGDIKNDIAPQVLTGMATGGSAIAAGISRPYYLDTPRFSHLAITGVREQAEAQKSSTSTVSTQALLSHSASLQEATSHITDALVARIAKMLQTTTSEVDTGKSLQSYGIDSLVAIEIVNWVLKELKAVISVIDVMAAVPMGVTAGKIAGLSGLLPKEILAN